MLTYWRQRFPLRLFGPVALGLAVPAQARGVDFASFASDALLILLLLAEFRLWDDLADRRRDAVDHPDRVLASSRLAPFVSILAVSFAVTIVAIALRAEAAGLVTFVLLASSFALFYARRVMRSASGDLFRLVKYPAFVFIAGSGGPLLVLLTCMVAAYVTACAYEAWHDPTSPIRFQRTTPSTAVRFTERAQGDNPSTAVRFVELPRGGDAQVEGS